MDDIICPECGRPNLIEAEKCWYCQTSLKEIKEESLFTNHPKHEEIGEVEEIPADEPIDNQPIPEWLKRVRKLKEADQPPEERDPSWQQEDLFNSEDSSPKGKRVSTKKRSHRKNTNHKEITKEMKNDDPEGLFEKKLDIIKRNENSNPAEDQEPDQMGYEGDEISHELPDGFTKL